MTDSVIPHRADVKIKWECSKGHQWESSYDNIRQGSGCPHCAGLFPKTLEDYHTLAESKGFSWVGPEVPNTRSKTAWQCKHGHQWETCYGTILDGHGCPHCARVFPKTPEDYHALARERDLEWIGPEVPNIRTKTAWRCSSGHVWYAPFGSVQSGRGCPVCIDRVNGLCVSKLQRQLCKMLPSDGILNYRIGPKAIDIALPKEKIAIEYDGWFWHGHNVDYDKQRDANLLAIGWKILRIRSGRKLPTQNQLDNSLAQLRNDEVRVEIILDDWGVGDTFMDRTNKISSQLDLFECAVSS